MVFNTPSAYVRRAKNVVKDTSYMIDENRGLTRKYEALFYKGYALLKLGLVRQAKREWDLLYKEANQNSSEYAQLADYELRMLTWRDLVADELLKLIE